MMRALVLAILLASGSADSRPAKPAPYASRAEVREFVDELVTRHGFVKGELEYVFAHARRERAILKAIAPPPAKDRRSWSAYRALFVNDRHIDGGVEFWRAHGAALQRAETEFGVPAEVIVAIIGIETTYGRNMGRWRVVDALATLAFDYPPRATFFRNELRNFLLFARDSGIDVFSVRGSYAGAIGIPQFMPGSYLQYAIDFDGDGTVDLRASAVDAVGSVANFLKRHGWLPGAPVMFAASVTGDGYRAYADGSVEPRHATADLLGAGVVAPDLPLQARVALIELDNGPAAREYRLGLANFYVLPRYNRSSFYACAVMDLAEALRAARQPEGR